MQRRKVFGPLTLEGKRLELGWLTEQCVRAHPNITVDPTETLGIPYMRGTKLTVCEVLGLLFVHGSMSRVEEIYSDITEEQVKEVILFASTFIELAYRSSRGD